MNRLLKSITIILLIFFLSPFIVADSFFASDINSGTDLVRQTRNGRVLFISSYTESFITIPEQIKGLWKGFENDSIDLDLEYMDAKRFADEESLILFHQWLSYRINRLPQYDVLIVGDDYALQYVMDYSEYFQMPIVFLGINDFDRANKAYATGKMTGVVEETSLAENIKLAAKINPQANRVVAIVDNTMTGQGDQRQFELAMEAFEHYEYEMVNSSDLNLNELAQKLSSYGQERIMLYLSMFEDIDGNQYTIPESVEFISTWTNIPVYRASIGGVGDGLFGGQMVSYVEQGRIAAQMALEIIDGKAINEIEMIEESTNFYYFDAALIDAFGIDKSLIPADAILVNQKISLYEENKQLFWFVAMIFIFLVCVTTITMFDNWRRRKMSEQLKDTNSELNIMYKTLEKSEETLRQQFITIQKHAAYIEQLNQKLQIAIDGTNSAVWEYDVGENKIVFSGNFHKIIHRQIDPLNNIIEYLDQFLLPHDRERFIELIHNCYEEKEMQLRLPVHDAKGSIIWLMIRGRGIRDGDDNLTSVSGIVLDVTKMQAQEEEIKYLADHDALTDLPNRHYFSTHAARMMKKYTKGAIMLLDLDNFKRINDTMGHIYGDRILKLIAERLMSLVSPLVIVSRFGGDEFLIMAIEEGHDNFIDKLANDISNLFKEPFYIDGQNNIINFSMGISLFPENGNDINKLIMQADTAMYYVKHRGRNSFVFFDKSMLAEVNDRVEIEKKIVKYLDEKLFSVVYQPQVDLKTGRINAFEALLRMPQSGLTPDLFIPVAEDSGLIVPLGRYVADTVIQFLADIKAKGLDALPIAINFSSSQIKDCDFPDYLYKKMFDHGLDTSLLEVEITEGILLHENEHTIDYLNRFTAHGIKLALDDFGTGYSSLKYLAYMPVSKIKLDKSLIDRFLDMKGKNVIESIMLMSHGLGMKVLAEGIETKDQLAKLRNTECDQVQGYLLSRPLPGLEIVNMLQTKHHFGETMVE